MLILGIFLKVVLGGGGDWWIFVGGGGFYLWVVVVGCAWVWWWQVVLCISVWWGFVEGFGFGICWRTGDCAVVLGSWLVVTAGAVCLYILGF